MKKECGILLPVFSLPSKYGIGSFSKEAYQFIDFLKEAGQTYWQILPLVPVDSTYSPYQSCSTFAGDYIYISLMHLVESGLLSIEEVDSLNWDCDPQFVDYEKVRSHKLYLLRVAFLRYNTDNYDFYIFCEEQKFWLDDYAKYMADINSDGTLFYKFIQYIFFKQWNQLKRYANIKGIRIIGDLPIYVSLDSADVRYNPELFQLEYGRPKAVAGCPPDQFSDNGQIWGNPLYDWNKHKETGYRWWIERIRHCFRLYDVVRIDHFRAMYDYFSIPYGDDTAKFGHWEYGPGMDLFNHIKKELGDVNIIAEDLGILSPGVIDLLNETGYPGMKILQFAFGGGSDNPYLPENMGTDNCIVYTGTHDNDTTVGWWNKASNWEKEHFKKYSSNSNPCWGMIDLAMSSRAKICIIPMQDYLQLDSYSRINTPGTIDGNWKWRLTQIPSEDLAYIIKCTAEHYNRY